MTRHPVHRHPARGAARRLFLACGAMLALAACSGDEPVRPCPQVTLLKDADRLVRFVGEGRDLTDVEFEAALRQPFLSCEYDDNVIEANLSFVVVASRGPADDDRLAEITYSVGIAHLNQQDVTREQFTVQIPFEGNRTQVGAIEEVEPRIPLQAGETAFDYKIVIGLRLTPDELQYNQENR